MRDQPERNVRRARQAGQTGTGENAVTCDSSWGIMGFELEGRALLEWMGEEIPSARFGVGLSRVGRYGLGEGERRLAGYSFPRVALIKHHSLAASPAGVCCLTALEAKARDPGASRGVPSEGCDRSDPGLSLASGSSIACGNIAILHMESSPCGCQPPNFPFL